MAHLSRHLAGLLHLSVQFSVVLGTGISMVFIRHGLLAQHQSLQTRPKHIGSYMRTFGSPHIRTLDSV